MNKKDFFLTLTIIIALLLLAIPLSLPIEGGLVFIIIGVIWLSTQFWRHLDFSVSKTFFIFIVLIVYMFIYRFYAKPIPITDIMLQRGLIYLMLTLFMYSSLRCDTDRKAWENALIALAIVVSLMSVLEVFKWYSKYSATIASLQVLPMPQIAYRLKGSFFGHPNPLAGFLNFVWPIIFVRLYTSKESLLKYLWGIILFLLAVTLLYTNSRGALLGTFAGVAFMFIAVMLDRGISFRKITSLSMQSKKQIGIALGTLSLLTLGVLWRSMFTGQFLNRSFSGRGTIWKYSWAAFLESPIFGQGMGAFPVSYTRLAQLPPGDFAPSAHNLWLHLSVDYGAQGFVFVCAIVGVFLFYSMKTLRSQSANNQLPYQFAYVSGGIAFLAQHTVDYMLVTVNYLVVSLIILVFLLKYVVLLGEWRLNRKSYAILGVVIIGMLAAYQLVASSKVISFSDYTRQTYLAENNEWMLLQEQVCSSAKKYPDNALYKFECSMALVRQISPLGQNGISKHDVDVLDKAIFFQQTGYDMNPYWATQRANLAVMYWEMGNQTRAIDLLEGAVSSAPVLDILLLNLGWMEEDVGNTEAALGYYTRALRLNPIINLSEFSQHSALFNIAAQDLIMWGESEQLWDSWYDNARHDRGGGSRDHEYWKGVIALSTGQYELAIKHFENRLSSNILGSPSSNLYVYLAYAYQLDGQPERAYMVAKDVVLLTSNEVHKIGGTVALSIIASILRDGGETDIAYNFLLGAFKNSNEKVFFTRYYPAIYTQQIIGSEISPLLIRNYDKLIYTQDDWEWVVEETIRRGDVRLAERIERWSRNLEGIAR